MDSSITRSHSLVDVSRQWPLSAVHSAPLPRSTAWGREDVTDANWLLGVPEDALAEIDAIVRFLRENPIPTLVLSPAEFELSACRLFAARLKAVLESGVGFAVVDRLPIDSYSKEECLAIYWLLSQLLARPVAQAFSGTLLYDVHDTGKKTDVRVRADKTNEDLSWHTDYGFNHPPPFIGLMVLRTALSGGVSSTGSLHTAHEVLRERDPRLLERLYKPYIWNRQGEHPEGSPICTSNPIFSDHGGELRCRFNRALQPVGYRLIGQEIDKDGMDALNALHDILSEPENHVDFVLEAGQMQFLNNARVAHRRTAFVDHDEPERKRHLSRIFLRDEGHRSYMG